MSTAAAYSLVQSATNTLRQNAEDAGARGQYALALRALGLNAVTDPFLQIESHAAVQGSGLIAWTSRRQRFAADVRPAAERWPELGNLEALWEAHWNDYQLHQSTDGNCHVLKRSNWDFHTAWMAGAAGSQGQRDGVDV